MSVLSVLEWLCSTGLVPGLELREYARATPGPAHRGRGGPGGGAYRSESSSYSSTYRADRAKTAAS